MFAPNMSDNITIDGGGLRYNDGKTRYDLVPGFAQEQYARVLTKGAIKYPERNWERGMPWMAVYASMERHMAAFKRGEDIDPETGVLHTAHIMCNAAFLTEYYRIYPQGDNRPKPYSNLSNLGLDVDEICCDWVGGWVETFKMEVPSSWFFDRNIIERFEELKLNNKLDDFYLSLKPLIDPKTIPYEPHCYVTSRPVDTSITEKWLDMHGFPSRPVYTVKTGHSKVEVLKDAGVEIFVDDRFDNFVEINKAGICCYLMDAKHNSRYDVGHKRIFKLSDLVTGDHLVRASRLK